ncbi:hypothetical protein ACSSS7_007082 [Eimeria intestinalis]
MEVLVERIGVLGRPRTLGEDHFDVIIRVFRRWRRGGEGEEGDGKDAGVHAGGHRAGALRAALNQAAPARAEEARERGVWAAGGEAGRRRAVLDVDLESLERQRPALEALARRFVVADVCKRGVVSADTRADAVDVRAERVQVPNECGGFQLGGCPLALVPKELSGGVGDNALACIGAVPLLACGLVQWRGDSKEVRDVAAVVVAFSEEAMDVFDGCGRGHVEDSADLGGTGLNALAAHDVAQVRDAGGAQAAFAGVELELRLAEALMEGFEVLAVVPPGSAVDDDVVDVADRCNPLHATQEHVEHALEDIGAGGEAEREAAVLALRHGEVAVALEGHQGVVNAGEGLLENRRRRRQAPDALPTMTMGTLQGLVGDRFPDLVAHGAGEAVGRRGQRGDVRPVDSRLPEVRRWDGFSAVVEAVRVLCEVLAERLQLTGGQAAVGRGDAREETSLSLPASQGVGRWRQGGAGMGRSAPLAGGAGAGAAGMQRVEKTAAGDVEARVVGPPGPDEQGLGGGVVRVFGPGLQGKVGGRSQSAGAQVDADILDCAHMGAPGVWPKKGGGADDDEEWGHGAERAKADLKRNASQDCEGGIGGTRDAALGGGSRAVFAGGPEEGGGDEGNVSASVDGLAAHAVNSCQRAGVRGAYRGRRQAVGASVEAEGTDDGGA